MDNDTKGIDKNGWSPPRNDKRAPNGSLVMAAKRYYHKHWFQLLLSSYTQTRNPGFVFSKPETLVLTQSPKFTNPNLDLAGSMLTQRKLFSAYASGESPGFTNPSRGLVGATDPNMLAPEIIFCQRPWLTHCCDKVYKRNSRIYLKILPPVLAFESCCRHLKLLRSRLQSIWTTKIQSAK